MVNKLLVESLRLPDQTVTLLHQLGVRRIEQLAQLPRASLRSRFGDELVARLNQLTGAEPELIIPHRPAAPLEAHWSLEHPTAHRATIQHIVAQLVEQVAQRLRQRDLGAVTIECRLHPSGSEPIEIRIGLFEPTAEPQHLLDLLRMQLETLAVPGAVGRASVRVVDSAPLVRRQHDLLADTLRHHPQQLAALVDRLSTRLGRDRVVRPQLHADAQPELAYRHVPLTGPQARRRDDQPHETLGPFHRPLLMHYPPLPLEVVSIVPDGPPVLFHHRGGQQQVACCWGPERIETGWWRGQSVRRDYYRIETAAGQRFWMFRRLQDGQWFLHGEFE